MVLFLLFSFFVDDIPNLKCLPDNKREAGSFPDYVVLTFTSYLEHREWWLLQLL